MVERFFSKDLDEYCETLTGYIEFCIDCCFPKKVIKRYARHNPWFNADVNMKLQQQNAAFKSGDAVAYKMSRYSLERSIKAAKCPYGSKIEGHFMQGDPQCMWRGLNSITSWKPNAGTAAISEPTL